MIRTFDAGNRAVHAGIVLPAMEKRTILKLKVRTTAGEQARGQLRDNRNSAGGVRTGSVVLRLPKTRQGRI